MSKGGVRLALGSVHGTMKVLDLQMGGRQLERSKPGVNIASPDFDWEETPGHRIIWTGFS